MSIRLSFASTAAALLCAASMSFADVHTTGAPVFNSRPGATYTVFLDPAGFNFNGQWGGGSTPGNNPALNGTVGVFTPADVTEISAIWAAMANQYRSFNVNVTTVDPAIAAGQAATDAQRQAYYDSQAHMMHTIIGAGGTPGWHGAADGLALGGTIDHVETQGAHTNFMFTEAQDGSPTVANGNYIGNISSHETGHTFGLVHQGDFTAGVVVNEYSNGDTATGNGSYVPTMGNASDRQRVAWRSGTGHNGANVYQQNDVATILSNNGAAIADSGIGHTTATATNLPITGNTVDVSSPTHRGVISPVVSALAGPTPIGVSNYTTDLFKFFSDGINPISLTLNNGNDFLVAGTADNGLTLRSTLSILDSSGTLFAAGLEDTSTLFSTYSALLASGTYFAKINSFGGHTEVAGFDAAAYYDMGGYFITGSGFAVPGPGVAVVFTFAGIFANRRRRNSNA